MLQIANIRKNANELADRLAIRGLDGQALIAQVIELMRGIEPKELRWRPCRPKAISYRPKSEICISPDKKKLAMH